MHILRPSLELLDVNNRFHNNYHHHHTWSSKFAKVMTRRHHRLCSGPLKHISLRHTLYISFSTWNVNYWKKSRVAYGPQARMYMRRQSTLPHWNVQSEWLPARQSKETLQILRVTTEGRPWGDFAFQLSYSTHEDAVIRAKVTHSLFIWNVIKGKAGER